MDDPNTTTDTLETEEDILTYTVSDDALEVAADMEKAVFCFCDKYCARWQ